MKESYECEVGAAMLADVPAGESPGIAADKAASLERWKSFCRQLPDSDG
jgi:hypothetical protein